MGEQLRSFKLGNMAASALSPEDKQMWIQEFEDVQPKKVKKKKAKKEKKSKKLENGVNLGVTGTNPSIINQTQGINFGKSMPNQLQEQKIDRISPQIMQS